MSLIVRDGGGNFERELTPSGSHVAICDMVVDLGRQKKEWNGEAKIVPQVYIGFQIPDEIMTWERDGVKHSGPRTIGKQYTLSLSEKANLRHDLESWRGRSFTSEELEGFDLFTIAGKPCLISVIHKISKSGRTYAAIQNISGMPKGMPVPERDGHIVTFTQGGDMDLVPEFLRKIIMEAVVDDKPAASSPRDDGPPLDAYDQDDLDDEIPF